jgi:hypothetical protein
VTQPRCGKGRFRLWRAAGAALALAAFPALAQAQAVAAVQVPPADHAAGFDGQASSRLYRLSSAWLPPDGLLRLGLGGRLYGTTYEIDGLLRQIDLRDVLFELEYGVLPAWHLRLDLPYRQWSNGAGWIPASGSGWGDGSLTMAFALPRLTESLAWSVAVESSLPTGKQAAGLSEGRLTPQLTGALSIRLWRAARLPEMRLHFNGGYRWNGNETHGYGTVQSEGFQPWFPRYPSVAAGGRNADNDYLFWGTALEFRQGTTSLFVEYSEARLPWSSRLSAREFQRFVTSGVTWGKVEGWAVRVAYDVSLAREDPATPFIAAYPDLVTYAAISRQFPWGGRDADRDGIPDRRDRCPGAAEDRDGFDDADGCPDLDNDGDGVVDIFDGAPDEPEDRDGFEDADGVPDPDNDGDGVPDERDACPDEAEDFDGYQDDDGCPEEFLDQDGDGIPDAEDRCPTRPEDVDGFEDDDGCPEADNDLDGIEDARDRCPDEPEDYNGVADDDGCPDGEVR